MFKKKVVEEIKAQVVCPTTFFEESAVYEIMWKLL
jgi:hypothetical protein